MTATPEDLLPTGFDQHLLAILEAAPEGLGEHALIKRLAADYPQSVFAIPGAFSDPLQLFRLHFLLFHTLYRLSDALNPAGLQLQIGAMRIAITPVTVSRPGLALSDPLRTYYLDWQQWAATNAADVQALLDSFWTRQSVALDGQVGQALAFLQLDVDSTFTQIKQRYRTLMSTHHPDRGGDTQHVQRINEAFLILKRYYRST
ncbi:DnaJ domain-containing protein [Pseudomonas sp. gcc21]|uniref:DNA-J related domain-containing protein n=1 Tax=Pseudomonas sp. gcc21 TaxID=2726989 RepID=UPI0014523335|nr:DNA-J related domain-containing protein [Pseudomonas sp. gcc21]QJD57977.1 DnaJ domain-containing protein [Pseudomonas sp. gcc21]